MNPVVHFEMGYFDPERMKKFYQSTFNWDLEQLGSEMGNYIVAHTTETDKDGMVKTPGNINGGFYKKTDDTNTQHPSLVIRVDDLKKHVKIVEAAGGKILGEPWNIPGTGWYVSFIDTEGNKVSMIQPAPMP